VQLRYDPDPAPASDSDSEGADGAEEAEEEDELPSEDAPPGSPSAPRVVTFLSTCRLYDHQECASAPPGTDVTLLWRREGRALLPGSDDELEDAEPAVVALTQGGGPSPEDDDAWMEALRTHISTLPILEQQAVAGSMAKGVEFLSTMMARLAQRARMRGDGQQTISGEDVREVQAELRAEIAAAEEP
jgi:hypothetical protein